MFHQWLASIFILISFQAIYARFDPFYYHHIPHEEVLKARKEGEEQKHRFENGVSNSTIHRRNELYDDYLSSCNKIGKERERVVAQSVKNVVRKVDYKLFLTMGMRQFVARFLTLPREQFVNGIKQLCTKFELQLQCQRGFGESRAQIYKRVEDLTAENGNLKILLEEQCTQLNFDPSPYFCMSDEPYLWTKPCFKEMLQYNYTRYSVGRRMANIHFDAVRNVTLLTYDKDLNEENQILTVKDKVQNIMVSALKEMAEIEGEKCSELEDVLKCVLPFVGFKCGSKVESMMKTMITVGYLAQERREDLQQHFKGFGVEDDPRCSKITSV